MRVRERGSNRGCGGVCAVLRLWSRSECYAATHVSQHIGRLLAVSCAVVCTARRCASVWVVLAPHIAVSPRTWTHVPAQSVGLSRARVLQNDLDVSEQMERAGCVELGIVRVRGAAWRSVAWRGVAGRGGAGRGVAGRGGAGRGGARWGGGGGVRSSGNDDGRGGHDGGVIT